MIQLQWCNKIGWGGMDMFLKHENDLVKMYDLLKNVWIMKWKM